jgi:vancomycin resistance protein VanJ
MTPPAKPSRRWACRLAAAYLAAVLLAWGLLELGGDSEAWPTLLLFGPRWPLGLPLVGLVPLAIWSRSRVAGGLLVAAAAVVAGPVAGGTLDPWPHLRPEGTVLMRLRVVTWNMQGTKPGPAFRQFLDDTRPDVVAFQEADLDLSPAAFPTGWHIAGMGDRMMLASRLPVRAGDELSPAALGAPGGGRRYTLDTPLGGLTVVNHPQPTVRLRDLGPLRDAIAVRARASRTARAWAGDPSESLVVVGDFNTPPAGRIYAADWGAFGNAFSDAGVGWGATKQTSWFGTRIDHVLYGPPWRCRAAWVGPAMGSDHRPLVADLILEDLP